MKWMIPLLFFFACGQSQRPLQFNLGAESVQVDWNLAIDSASVVLLDNIMEGLTSYADSVQAPRSDVVRPLPALAESWSISEGGKVYRFRLKKGVLWGDGVELEASHFVDSWERLLSPKTGSPNAYHLFEIQNAKAFNEGIEKDFSKVGARALDKYSLEVRLRRQVPYFLHLVASASTFPIRKDLISKFGEGWTDPQNLVTLGPYRLSTWVQGERIELSASTVYSGKRPSIEKVVCRLIAEPLTAYVLYENDALDILPKDLPASFLKTLLDRADYRSGPKLQVSYLLFNTKRAPFQRAENRIAFVEALNRQKLAAYFQGSATPTNSWIPPGLLAYDGEVGLDSTGRFGDFLRGKSFELHFSGGDTWNLLFQDLQAQLEEKLSARVRLIQLDSSKFSQILANLASKKLKQESLPALIHLSWVADYPDPHSFMNVFTTSSEGNYGKWSNHEYDQLVEKAVGTSDENERAVLYSRAQKILLEEEAVLMPLFFTSHRALVRSSLEGVQLNVLDKWYFRNWSFVRTGWRGLGSSLWMRLKQSVGKNLGT